MNSFRRNIKRRTDTYRLAIATWCAAGDFAAVQQHRVGFHFRRVDLHTLAVFVFHQTMEGGWRPTVRPPRLGGNARMGVFATRSTFRPNPIGMSLVDL